MDTNTTARTMPVGPPLGAGELDAAYRTSLGEGTTAQAWVVWWALHHDPDLERSSVARLGETIWSFAARQHTLGRDRLAATTVEDAAGFVWARTRRGHPPALATAHLRRTALRLCFRVLARLDGDVEDPTATLVLPSKTRADLRPLTDDELALLRIAASTRPRGRLRAMVTVALAEATATTGEIAQLCWRDLTLDGHVALPGAGRVQPRTGQLTLWGRSAVDGLAAVIGRPPDAPVVYRGSAAGGSQPAQAAVVNSLRRLLARAGLDDDDLRPTSVRLWAPAQQLQSGARVEAAARQLGLVSLDLTAELLGYDWQDG